MKKNNPINMKQTSKSFKINLKYRDEECSACHKTFRAGIACSGYFHLIAIGYHNIMDRSKLLICNDCKDIIYRLLGIPPTEDLIKAPSKLYKIEAFGRERPRPVAMTINQEHVKYNAKKLLQAVRKFDKKMKRKYPWSNVDWFEVAGIKIRK